MGVGAQWGLGQPHVEIKGPICISGPRPSNLGVWLQLYCVIVIKITMLELLAFDEYCRFDTSA
jgi:hypothetical protein